VIIDIIIKLPTIFSIQEMSVMNLTDISEEYVRGIADSATSFETGRRLSSSVAIVSNETGNVKARVKESGSNHNVNIYATEAGTINARCTCPTKSNGCKHIVAVMMRLHKENSLFRKVPGTVSQDVFSIEDLLRRASAEEICEGLKAFAESASNVQKEGDCYHVQMGAWRVEFRQDADAGEAAILSKCTCKDYPLGKRCGHIIPAMIAVMKSQNKITPEFEREISSKANKLESGFSSIASLLEKGQETKQSTDPVIFSFSSHGENLFLSVVRRKLGKAGVFQVQLTKEDVAGTKLKFSDGKRKLCELLARGTPDDSGITYTFGNDGDEDVLDILRKVFQTEQTSFSGLALPAEKAAAEFHFVQGETGTYVLRMLAALHGGSIDLSAAKLYGRSAVWLISQKGSTSVAQELDVPDPKIIRELLLLKDLSLSSANLNKFLALYYSQLSAIGKVVLPRQYSVHEVADAAPRPRLMLKDNGASFSLELRMVYMGNEVRFLEQREPVAIEKGTKVQIIRRDRIAEMELYTNLLDNDIFEKDGLLVPVNNPLQWLTGSAPKLIAQGYEIFGEDALVNKRLIKERPKLRLDVFSDIDWFDLDGDVSFGEEKISLDQLLDSLDRNEKFIKLSSGKLGVIPDKWISLLSPLSGLLKKDGGRRRAAISQIPLIEAMLELADKAKADDNFMKKRASFMEFKGLKDYPIPKRLIGTFRDYQKAGYNWLMFLNEFSLGGCLADEMGLGKTFQVLAMLLQEQEKGYNVPSLIVVPTSLVFNWVGEVKKFAPSLKVYVYHGSERDKDIAKLFSDKTDIIITTYGTLRSDLDNFRNRMFHYIILDESHHIKNPLSQNTKAVNSLQAHHRLAITGTPVENNSLELWSQFAFINPGLLGDMEYFRKTFVKSIVKDKDKSKADALKVMTSPYILMRKKETVAKDLPDKQIATLYCDMDTSQRTVYDQWKNRFRKEISISIERVGLMQSKIKVLEGLTKLRQLCNHPVLLDEGYIGGSGKFEILTEQIEEVAESGHKILVFSSFVKMLNLLRDHFEGKGIMCSYLDGSTDNRQEVVNEFQHNPDLKVFLISLKAGGVGLNLTQADYVFIVDPWWNPAAEMQAIDRAHRIGQKNKVFVYKAITKDSVEEKILELQESKKELVRNVISVEEGIIKKLSASDIKGLFG
jgi:non-specific serine/threonine protein kinase